MKKLNYYFEPYEDKNKIKTPYISIWGKDKIFLSSQFVNDNKKHLDGMKYCMLLYSSKHKSIGLQFSKKGSVSGGERFYKLTYYKKDKGIVITCSNFFKYYYLDSEELSGRYAPFFIEDRSKGEMLVIYLKEKMERIK